MLASVRRALTTAQKLRFENRCTNMRVTVPFGNLHFRVKVDAVPAALELHVTGCKKQKKMVRFHETNHQRQHR